MYSQAGLNLMGIFDVSKTIATSISYQIVLQDPFNATVSGTPAQALPPIIVFAIVICSLFGAFVFIVSGIYLCRRITFTTKKASLIRMNNEISTKGGDIQKYPLTKAAANPGHFSDEANAHDNEAPKEKIKLSNFLVSQENLQRIEKQQKRMAEEKGYNLTVDDIRRRTDYSKPENVFP